MVYKKIAGFLKGKPEAKKKPESTSLEFIRFNDTIKNKKKVEADLKRVTDKLKASKKTRNWMYWENVEVKGTKNPNSKDNSCSVIMVFTTDVKENDSVKKAFSEIGFKEK